MQFSKSRAPHPIIPGRSSALSSSSWSNRTDLQNGIIIIILIIMKKKKTVDLRSPSIIIRVYVVLSRPTNITSTQRRQRLDRILPNRVTCSARVTYPFLSPPPYLERKLLKKYGCVTPLLYFPWKIKKKQTNVYTRADNYSIRKRHL